MGLIKYITVLIAFIRTRSRGQGSDVILCEEALKPETALHVFSDQD